MKMELDMAKAQYALHQLPLRTEPNVPEVEQPETVSARRVVRMATDELIQTGLLTKDVACLTLSLCETMTMTAGMCAQFGVTPQIDDFLFGVKDLVEDIRVVMENGISSREWDQVRVAACMMQVLIGGSCYMLNLPYMEAMQLTHDAYMGGERPTKESMAALLREHGFQLDATSTAQEA